MIRRLDKPLSNNGPTVGEWLLANAEMETANDPTPASVYQSQKVEAVEARALVERARWQARQNASLVCCDYED